MTAIEALYLWSVFKMVYFEKVTKTFSATFEKRVCSDLMVLQRSGDKIASVHTRKKYEIIEIGIMYPEEVPTGQLFPGQVGYITCNMKQSSEGMCHPLHHICSVQRMLKCQIFY